MILRKVVKEVFENWMQTFYIKGNLQYFRFIKNILIYLLYNFPNQVAKCDDCDETGGIWRALNKFYDSKPERIYNSYYGNGVPAMFTS